VRVCASDSSSRREGRTGGDGGKIEAALSQAPGRAPGNLAPGDHVLRACSLSTRLVHFPLARRRRRHRRLLTTNRYINCLSSANQVVIKLLHVVFVGSARVRRKCLLRFFADLSSLDLYLLAHFLIRAGLVFNCVLVLLTTFGQAQLKQRVKCLLSAVSIFRSRLLVSYLSGKSVCLKASILCPRKGGLRYSLKDDSCIYCFFTLLATFAQAHI
jgi:hypothetical protein